MNRYKQTNYVLIEEHKKEQVEIYDETVNKLYLFCANKKNICIRKEGNVVFDKNWRSLLKTHAQIKKLKDFLGGMYIAEMQKEINEGTFFVADLNEKKVSNLQNNYLHAA